MAKGRSKARKIKVRESKPRPSFFRLPQETTRTLWGIIMFLLAIIIGLSFFRLAGSAGEFFVRLFSALIGRTVFLTPLLFALTGLVFFSTHRKHFLFPILFALLLTIAGIDGILGALGIFNKRDISDMGGWLGYLLSWVPMNFFGIWVTLLIFFAVIAAAFIVAWQMIVRPQQDGVSSSKKDMPSAIKKIFSPRFKIKEVSLEQDGRQSREVSPLIQADTSRAGLQLKSISEDKDKIASAPFSLKGQAPLSDYKLPPIDLLEPERGQAQSGDIKVNSAIIKRTLENFDIPVEISEVNVGPTVTQYALKPAEGIKLSRITALNNDLALALAAHPIRIEAPIPGRPLVGIEVPNRVRAQVRLRNLLENPVFQQSPSHLMFSLGRDVAGNPVYADLARMPHLLVAGSTGTGKTIGLNALILSLLYQNSPDIMRFILIDPKRVEFPIYNDLPHLLTPVIFDSSKTVLALKWLIGEMERRFEVLSAAGARDVALYNSAILKDGKELMPYIILIVDELADLMAARGRDIEAGIVRLAQMARAVGIHLVVATQRPSVEVITGLIKANITSRMAFQVASQVDSRTVLDASGSEKLLGLGDMLFVSAEISKPRRIQGSYVSEKEVKKVVKFIKDQSSGSGAEKAHDLEIAEDLEKTLQEPPVSADYFSGGEDPLYEDAKKLVIETRKASASFLQRRLRLGYARAARLIDILEEKGVVGPGEGAKPREVLIGGPDEEEEWKKV